MISHDLVKVRAQIPVHIENRTFISVQSWKRCIEMRLLVAVLQKTPLYQSVSSASGLLVKVETACPHQKKSCLLHPILSGTESITAPHV